MKRAVLVAIAAALTIANPKTAQACRGLDSESKTFFKSLPPKADTKSVAAKVKVLSTQLKGTARLTEVLVVEGFRGALTGAKLKIESEIHSCSRDPEIKAGETYYVAGSVSSGGLFRGELMYSDWPESDKP